MRFDPLLARRNRVIAFALALAALAAPGLLRLEIDNSPEGFFVEDEAQLARYRQHELDFGRDRGVRLVARGPGLWTPEGLAWLEEAEERAAALHGVIGSVGLYRHHRWRFSGWPPPEPAAFRREALSDPVDRQAGLVGSRGETVTVLIGLYALPPAEENRTLAALATIAASSPPGIRATLTGLPVVRAALDREVVRVAARFFPWLAVLAALGLALAFRRAAHVAAPIALVALTEIVVFGAMGYAGARLDMITIVLMPILFVVGLATAVHMLACFRALLAEGLDGTRAARETLVQKGWPVVWTGVTTAVGFGSLAVSAAAPIRTLGAWAAVGLGFLTLAALTVYPCLLAATGPGGRRAAGGRRLGGFEPWASRRGRASADGAIRRHREVYAGFAALALIAAIGLAGLHTETSALSYLSPAHPVRAEIAALEGAGIGAVAADLVVEAADGEPGLRTPEGLERLAGLTAVLRGEEAVLGVLSAGDLALSAAPASAGEPARWDAALVRIEEVPDLGRMLDFLVTSDGRRARLSLAVPMRGHRELEPIFQRAEAAARAAFPAADIWVTGRYPLVLAAQHSLLRTMLLSFALTLACVAAIFFGLLGSPSLAVRALVPNLWPVVLVVGAMGWLGVPVDSTTVMIAAVVLALAVDDTLHALGYFRRFVGEGGLSPPAAAAAAIERTAGAHLATSALLAAGFALFAWSSFVPVSRFGALTAGAVLAALAADLVLVPALLAGAQPTGER